MNKREIKFVTLNCILSPRTKGELLEFPYQKYIFEQNAIPE